MLIVIGWNKILDKDMNTISDSYLKLEKENEKLKKKCDRQKKELHDLKMKWDFYYHVRHSNKKLKDKI